MKAIYINLDPYLAAFAAWLKANPADPDTGEHATPPPTFNPLPLAVTIPLGESAAMFLPGGGDADSEPGEVDASTDSVNLWYVFDHNGEWPAGCIAYDVAPGLSSLTPAAKYAVMPVNSDTSIRIRWGDEVDTLGTLEIPVLVRREQAQGPVDLVDFTPPASTIAAGTDLKGTKFNGNEIVAAAGTGALSAPAGS